MFGVESIVSGILRGGMKAGTSAGLTQIGKSAWKPMVQTAGREVRRKSLECMGRNALTGLGRDLMKGGVKSLSVELGGETYRNVLTSGAEKLMEWTKGKVNLTEAAAYLDELTKDITIRDTDVMDMIEERRRRKREQLREQQEEYEDAYEEEVFGSEGPSREEMEMLIQMVLLMREMKQREEAQEE